MGNSECKFSQIFNKKYEFVQFVKDRVLGPIKIYRKKQPFYDYLMIVERSINEDELQKYLKQLTVIQKSFKTEQQSSFLRVYGHQAIKESVKNCNIKQKIRMYIQFYNYSLRDLIQHRNQQKSKFNSEEIMYVLANILKIYYFYESIQALNVSFQSNGIFITPEGEVRFNPLQIFGSQESSGVECGELNCRSMKFKKIFKMKDKLVVYEIKKIVAEMTELCDPVFAEDRSIFIFKKKISECLTVKDVQSLVYVPLVQKLDFSSKKTAPSEEQTTKICKNSPLVSNSEFSHSSKISVKNVIRQLRNQRPLTQYRQHYP